MRDDTGLPLSAEQLNRRGHEDTLYYWCNRFVNSTDWAELHPDAHDGDELDYCRDNIARCTAEP